VRNAAWQCLLDNGITSLPVDLLKIVNATGVKLAKNTVVGLLSGNENASCILENETWHLIYDDEASLGRRRVAIAHELGHIFLGHELSNGNRGRTFIARKPQEESQADAFAARLLSPACVLWGLNLRTTDEIAEACGISIAEAKKRAERMTELYERQKFLTAPLEKKLYEQFKAFIEQTNKPLE
jgi:Zn-dependent peptidase ImmA (M78 family)